MKVSLISAALLAGVCSTVSPGSLAQIPSDLSVEIGKCAEVRSAVDRLDCYDRLAESAELARGVSRIVEAEPAGVTPESPAEPSSEGTAEIISKITALEEYVPNAYRITLENGQVWRQVESRRYPLRIGYTVRVYESRWRGAYRLSAEGLNGFIRVELVE